MTTTLGLDEIPTSELEAELAQRRERIRNHRCDYCGRKVTTAPCKFPLRHILKLRPSTYVLVRTTKQIDAALERAEDYHSNEGTYDFELRELFNWLTGQSEDDPTR